jgi:hypothetical protein
MQIEYEEEVITNKFIVMKLTTSEAKELQKLLGFIDQTTTPRDLDYRLDELKVSIRKAINAAGEVSPS